MNITKQSLNILFLTYQGDIAGSTNSIFYLADGLAKRGHNVYVGCRRESLLFSMLEDSPAIAVPMTFSGSFDLKNARQIAQTVKEHKIRIINAQSSRDRYSSILANWLFGLKVKVFHTRRQIPKSSGFFLQNLFYTAGSEKIIAVSRGVKDALVKLGIPENHIIIIHNGTPPEKYKIVSEKIIDRLGKRYNISEEDIVIGCVSRNKQQEQLLQALNFFKEQVKVILVGAEERPYYREITSNYKIAQEIIYTGVLDDVETLNIYKLFKVKVLPSITEGLSQALLEAMTLGIPVIATKAAGNLDLIVDGVNGFFFEENNIEELAGKIKIALNDAGMREKLITNAKKTAREDFSLDKTLDEYEKLFRQYC